MLAQIAKRTGLRPEVSKVAKPANNPLHLTAGVGCGVESHGCPPAAGERER